MFSREAEILGINGGKTTWILVHATIIGEKSLDKASAGWKPQEADNKSQSKSKSLGIQGAKHVTLNLSPHAIESKVLMPKLEERMNLLSRREIEKEKQESACLQCSSSPVYSVGQCCLPWEWPSPLPPVYIQAHIPVPCGNSLQIHSEIIFTNSSGFP